VGHVTEIQFAAGAGIFLFTTVTISRQLGESHPVHIGGEMFPFDKVAGVPN
jgi:hypothetical protein